MVGASTPDMLTHKRSVITKSIANRLTAPTSLLSAPDKTFHFYTSITLLH